MSVTSTPPSKRNWRNFNEAEKAGFLQHLREKNGKNPDGTRRETALLGWVPNPGPQTEAFTCQADELFYGGAAGGGKTDLVLGLAGKSHQRSIIFRREYPQLAGIIDRSREVYGAAGTFNANANVWRLGSGRQVEFGAVQYERDWQKYQGRAHDLKAFDELPHFTRAQYRLLIAWNRTTDTRQRCRVVAAGNPPVPGQGEWILEEWAPWLDPTFPNPARPGELRWYAMLPQEGGAAVLAWVTGGASFEHRGETIYPRSRTFIPARVQDNPYLWNTGYVATLQALPEPLRSQLLKGDFQAAAEDNPWQVIPTAWTLAAMARGRGRERPAGPLSCLGTDVARGGAAQTVLARRYANWVAPLEKHPGRTTPDGPAVAALVVQALEAESGSGPVNIDPIAVGTSPLDILRANRIDVRAINFAGGAKDEQGKPFLDRSKKYRFGNLRAAAYWRLREALDPKTGDDLALPDDRELLGDLCAPRYRLTTAGIMLEDKDEIAERLGRSPDCGDAVVLACWQGGPVPGAPAAGGTRPLVSAYQRQVGPYTGLTGGLR